jgi:cytochrome c-type biogenesis protein CcmH/NrfF
MAQTALHTSQVHPLSTGLKLNCTNQTHLCQQGSTQSIHKSNTPLSTRLNPIYTQIKHTSVNKAQPNLCTNQTHLCQQGSTQSMHRSNTPLSTRLNPIYAQIKHTSVNKAQPNIYTNQTHLCQQGSTQSMHK